MYQIEIKTHDTLQITEGERFSTKNLLFMVLNSVPKDGMSDEEGVIRQSIRQSLVELGNRPFLLLEDAEFKVLLNIINTMGKKNADGSLIATGWQFQDPMAWDFCKEMRELKSFKPAKLTEIEKPSENGKHEGKIRKVK